MHCRPDTVSVHWKNSLRSVSLQLTAEECLRLSVSRTVGPVKPMLVLYPAPGARAYHDRPGPRLARGQSGQLVGPGFFVTPHAGVAGHPTSVRASSCSNSNCSNCHQIWWGFGEALVTDPLQRFRFFTPTLIGLSHIQSSDLVCLFHIQLRLKYQSRVF